MDSHASIATRAALLAIALVAAPACMAQQASQPEAGGATGTTNDSATETATATEGTEPPRSPFGKVMSLLIAELQRNAETPGATAPTDEPRGAHAPKKAETARLGRRGSVQQIQVSDRFRLDRQPAVAKGD